MKNVKEMVKMMRIEIMNLWQSTLRCIQVSSLMGIPGFVSFDMIFVVGLGIA